MNNKLLEKAFDPESFRSKGHQLVDQLADLLGDSLNGKGKVTLAQSPDPLYEQWNNQTNQRISTKDYFQKVIDQSINLHHPHYIGHQVSVPLPLGALATTLTSLLNNGMGIYEMGECATAIEKVVVDVFCKQVGYANGNGILTSGGSLATLTALLSARARYQDIQIWEKGTHEHYCVLVSDMAHYCVERAVRIMGWGAEGIIKVPVNDQYAMDTSRLSELYEASIEQGKKVIAIVGSAPCTATGSYDNFKQIAQFCEAYNIWFHIDGAHGGPAVFSEKYNYLMKGVERADSIVIDAHKMMMIPALATVLLFKNASDSYNTFSQKAYYLWEAQEKEEWYNLARRTFECTKYMMGVKIFAVINEYGLEIFDEYVTRQYDLARQFADLIEKEKHFELAIRPEANIVCFRFRPEGLTLKKLSELNRSIRKGMHEDGKFYLVQTELKGGLYLRVTLMNAFTTIDHLAEMLEEIRKTGLVNSKKLV